MIVPDTAFFQRLLRGDKYRFEFGVRRGDEDWFRPSPESSVLAERRRWLAQTGVPVVFWQDDAAEVLAEALSLFPEFAGSAEHCSAGESAVSGPSDARRSDRSRLETFTAGWEPDFVLLRRTPEDEFRMVGGCVCFPSSWDPAEKLGHTVEAIHGPVPTLNAELGARIRTFLAKLPPGAVFERENWGLAVVPERNMHPLRRLPRLSAATRLDQVWLRVEHQAFRALPQSSGLLFVIHLTVHRLTDVLADPVTKAAFTQMLETMPDSIAGYKGIQPARVALLAQLR